MAKLAILLLEDSPTTSELRLGRILDFFGVRWQTAELCKLPDITESTEEYVVFGSAETIATALKSERPAVHSLMGRASAVYIYAGEDLSANTRAFQSFSSKADVALQEARADDISIRVSGELGDLAGPMAGLDFSCRLRKEDFVVVGTVAREEQKVSIVISAGGAPVFLQFRHNNVPIFFCASSYMVDIDQTMGRGFYDVKDHFCSAVSLVMFLRFMFQEVAWHPQELGACLIVDDPLLKHRYGHCDFENLRDLMQRHGFTTNIAFIPWNWRRTSAINGDFFKRESKYFSVSIHGCDHIKDEFGVTSFTVLDERAKLAQVRMRNHKARTGIRHDPVMVFPQGVFSSVCPDMLKRNGFLAAVNTELQPVDGGSARTCIRDVWDVAIRTYGGFPVFTRRYAFHGLENFAFDLLLGKSCLIVSHHEFFKNRAAEVVELVEKLQSLNCTLQWRPLGDVMRRACRRRRVVAGVEEVDMYGNDLLIDNPSSMEIDLRIRKRENNSDLVAEICSDGKSVAWTAEADQLEFRTRISPCSEAQLQVVYRESTKATKAGRSIRFELSVAIRRVLSEFRDDYLSRSRFLTATMATLRNGVTRLS